MRKIVFLEGLPGIGKTTICNTIKSMNLDNIHVVDEIIKEDIINHVSDDENDYMINDNMKIDKYHDGLIIMDRGPISTLSYNQTRNIIEDGFDPTPVLKWFETVKDVYKEDIKIIFLTNNQSSFKITSKDINDPYGSIENQKLLERVTLFNCNKYSDNVIIRDYYQKDMEDLVNEIIS